MKRYEISVPMPYKKEQIDSLCDINSKIEKSAITSVYFSLPASCGFHTGFEQDRNCAYELSDFEYWKDLMAYTLNKGFDIIYLLNSPRRLEIEEPEKIAIQIDILHKLLNELNKIGVNKLRVSNARLLTFLSQNFKNFELYASTSFEYKTIKEYINFIALHPTVKQIVPSHDINKNFKLLKNIRKALPNVDIEVMLNEGCMGGCPHRLEHSMTKFSKPTVSKEFSFNTNYCAYLCNFMVDKEPFLQLTKAGNIYPWEIEEYEKINIRKYKLVSTREAYLFEGESILQCFYDYLKAIDDDKYADDKYINQFIHRIKIKNIYKMLVKDIRPMLPKISHFKKYGHLCASVCGIECRYCYKCAEKIEQYAKKNGLY